MIHGIGVDLIDQRRIEPLLADRSDPFFRKTYTEAERTAAEASSDPPRYYAERFAAKEAVFKALGINGDGIRLNEIETLNDSRGIPRVTLHGALEERRRAMGITAVHISVSNEWPYSVAYVICEADDTRSCENGTDRSQK